ncbi:MAG: FAD-dependent protein [Clostridiaceae bacterium]
MLRISDIKIAACQAADPETERQALYEIILARLKIGKNDLIRYEIFKKSVDARKKDEIFYVYTVDAEVRNQKSMLGKSGSRGIIPTPGQSYKGVPFGTAGLKERPVIIGMGPAGLFAGLILARNGYRPILLERGEDVDARTVKINRFWNGGMLDTESNVQFGEGGAGTFSDGKLTTLISDIRCRIVLEEFVKAGAPREILFLNKPHIGTDLLKSTVKNIRHEIIACGGDVRFKAKVTDFVIEDGKLEALIIKDIETLQCGVVLLAIGHSARDTFEVLYNRGVSMSPKPFSIGVRIEHPQEMINTSQYGEAAGRYGLGAADYKLAYHGANGRSAYTFCMCPGGYVVAAASEEQCVVTNGMSEYKRDGENANSALLVGVGPDDFGSSHPLAGIGFQRKWERLAYLAGGANYYAPEQLTGDFLADRPSISWGSVKPTYRPGVVFAEIKNCLPDYVIETMKEAILYFDTRIRGFAMPDSILTGIETRSSSPVRINRDDRFLSSIPGIYPAGEGAGYAGGIMSSAVDGVKTAEKVMEKYAPFK